MEIQAFGYVGVRTRTLEDWASFGPNLVGLQPVDRSAKSLAFRMDDRKQRIVVTEDGGDGAAFFGWEVADAAALDRLAARLEGAGVAVTRGSRALADERRVADLVVFHDPAGNRLEAFHGAEAADTPFKPGRNISGFRTGPLGLGHAVLIVERLDDVMPFYTDLLGFRLSDYVLKPFRVFFFHVNPRHHSLAFIEMGDRKGVHHLMVELYSLDDVGQGYDVALGDPERLIATTLGRHVNDYMTSFYAHTPSRFLIECGWGGRVIEPEAWQPGEVTAGPSLWGHDRRWISPEAQQAAREMRLKAAREGLRAPVQVIEGNYQLMPGVCPWFDYTRLQAAE
ncbi:MAG TPA: VOC family protein [Xanthobacteraceae bacterium]|nr:VOC family protein [Xanthobacteraceae bacterium]